VLDISESNERQYWLWVTRPDYYLDEDGCDREDLDPTLGADSDGWWTCNKATKEGDLVLLWALSRNQVKLGFLLAINCFIPDIIANVVAYSGQI